MSSATPPPSALKLALMAKQARAQTSSIARAEPIAVVGIGCRFPGGADSPEKFWKVLHEGIDTVAEIPNSRWDLEAHFDADPSTPGKSYIRHAALLDRVDTFDAAFFRILPREAERMDPQQRIFMEVAIDAFDHAGLSREKLAGSRTSVFVAVYHTDYAQLQYADPEWIDPRTLTGILQSVIPNRLSYWLDLRGPSVALDSACSSSLVGIHLACQSLRWGETDLALAGGINVVASPELMVPLSKVGFTSLGGRCRTFDAGADGFVRGEGCGVVVLKRLSDAIASGDRILSVIRSSVVNQDGHSTVMAAPNGLAQQALVREALANARIEPSRVGFVEAHGTATPLGDPIEVEALAASVGAPRADGSVCYLGSVKANIGHLEAAAGVAGLIKATLALQHAEIPGQVHFKKLNPHLSLEGSCLKVSSTTLPWPAGALPRVAGVSSFGVGGTNAHVILEEAPALPPEPTAGVQVAPDAQAAGAQGTQGGAGVQASGAQGTQRGAGVQASGGKAAQGAGAPGTQGVPGMQAASVRADSADLAAAAASIAANGPFLLPLSAQSSNALRESAERWLEFLPSVQATVGALCTAAGERRSTYDYRLGVVGGSVPELQDRLRSFLAGTPSPGVVTGHRSASGQQRLAFVFGGQGPQWFGMGRELVAQEPVFRDALVAVDAALRQHATWSLLDELAADEGRSRLGETEVAQLAIFAIQVALAALWKSWDVEPDAVVGHSIGEFAALHVAGVLSLEEAVRVVWHRARAMQRATGLGAMATVGLDIAAAEDLVRSFGQDLSLAAINSPRGIVLSGRKESLATALAELDRRGVQHRTLPVNYAFHSAQMQSLADEFVASLGRVATGPSLLPIYSTVTGLAAEDAEFGAAYFGRNVRQTVRFAAAVEAMLEDGFTTFVEIGPHPVLGSSISECAAAQDAEVVLLASLRRGRPERETLLQACAGVFASVRAPRWELVNRLQATTIHLPAYPWQRERHWVRERPAVTGKSLAAGDVRAGAANRGAAVHEPPVHELLGDRVAAAAATIFSASWPHRAPAWLADHRVAGKLLMPATGMLEALRAAASEALGTQGVTLEDFIVHHPLVLTEHDGGDVTWQTTVQDPVDARVKVTLHERLTSGRSGATWRLIASATASRAALANGSDAGAAGRGAVTNGSDAGAAGRGAVANGSDAGVAGRTPAPAFASRGGADSLASDRSSSLSNAVGTASAAGLYPAFAELGVAFGSEFQTVKELRATDSGATGWVARNVHGGTSASAAGVAATASGVHPTLLDGALQICLTAASGGASGIPRELMLPLGIDRYTVFGTSASGATPDRLHASVEFRRVSGSGALTANVRLHAPDGVLVALLEGARLAPVSREALTALSGSDDWLYEVAWQPSKPRQETPAGAAKGAWLVLCDAGGVGDALADALAARGARCLRVRTGDRAEMLAPGARRIDPNRPEHWDALLADAAWRDGADLSGVVHLWSLDITSSTSSGANTSARSFEADDMLSSGSGLLALQALLRSSSAQAELVFVTSGAQPAGGATSRPTAAGLWGLVSTAAVEMPDLSCRVIDLDSDSAPDAAWLATELEVTGVAGPGAVPRRLAVRGAQLLEPRLQRLRTDPRLDDPVRLHAGNTGTLDSLEWRPATAPAPAADEARVRVVAAGLNFRDVLLALGMYPNAAGLPLGGECAGIVEGVGSAVTHLRPGDAVFGFAQASLATEVTLPAGFLAPVPPGLTMEQAAALPAAYLTAMFGLNRKAGMKEGTRVLIHAAAGGVGMAAVQLALRAGAEVFATAGSPAKRELLQSLGVRHVFDSRSTRFAEEVRAATGGVGVDIVLNSLAGDFIPASLGVLRTGGWFLELGKRDIMSVEEADRARPDARYLAYDLGAEANADRTLLPALMKDLVAALAAGELRPLPVRVFDFRDAQSAFRFMAQARHTGKLVLRAPQAAHIALATPGAQMAHGSKSAQRQVFEAPLVRDGATYLISGGLGALGVRTARWLVESGARSIVLVGRHPPVAAAESIIHECEARGARVQQRFADISDRQAIRDIFEEIRRDLPPLRGVIHAAGALDDGVLLQQDMRRWEAVLRGKAHGARVLHDLTRNLPLDFFVLYSAAGLLLGPGGQGPYAAANAELDALAHARRSIGLPATSVAWGMWGEAGMAANMAAQGNWSARGLGSITAKEGFARLERIIRLGVAHAAALPIDWSRFASALPTGPDREFFRAVLPAGEAAAANTKKDAPAVVSRVAQWRGAPETQRRSLVSAHVSELALSVLGLNASTVLEPRAPLKDAGLDSLMAVELRNALTRSIAQSLPATLLFDYPSVDSLTTYLMRVLQLNPEAVAVPEVKSVSIAAVASMSEAEAEAELLAELSGPVRRSGS